MCGAHDAYEHEIQEVYYNWHSPSGGYRWTAAIPACAWRQCAVFTEPTCGITCGAGPASSTNGKVSKLNMIEVVECFHIGALRSRSGVTPLFSSYELHEHIFVTIATSCATPPHGWWWIRKTSCCYCLPSLQLQVTIFIKIHISHEVISGNFMVYLGPVGSKRWTNARRMGGAWNDASSTTIPVFISYPQ